MMAERVEAYLGCRGTFHDFGVVERRLRSLLAEDRRIRVDVGSHYRDVAAITGSRFLVRGIEPSMTTNEFRLCEYFEGLVPWLVTRGEGDVPGFLLDDWTGEQ